MASFTDRVPQFNPYVSQQPVEDMVKVGMMKQQQYDTNLEKIYQNMNNISGLDILKDSAQDYLNNKMNEVSKELQYYASGDFSQKNLTRRVNNIITGIAEDETIISAVQSTAKVRNEISKMISAQKEGKSSVINEHFLYKDINDWMKGTDPGESFNGAWIPYIDVDAKLREVYESMEDTDITIQNPFQRDSQGNILYYDSNNSVSLDPSKGSPRIDHVMLQKTVKGKSAEKILNNFYTSLSADELRQLDMNGRYYYRDATVETFAPALKKAAETKKDFYKNSLKQIAIELESNDTLSADEIKALSQTATEYKNALNSGQIDKDLNQQLIALKDPNNLESMKANIYKDQYLRNMALNLETESISIEYKNNPYFDADMKMKEYNLKVREFNNKMMHQDRMYNLELLKWQTKQQEKLYAGQGRVRAGDISTEIENTEIEYASYEKDNQDLTDQIDQLGIRVIPYTSLQMLDIDISGAKDEKEVIIMKLEALTNMYKDWKGGKKFQNASLNEYFKRRDIMEEKKALNTTLMFGADRAVEKAGITQKLDDLPKQYPSFIVNGETLTFQEIMEARADYNQYRYKDVIDVDQDGPIMGYTTDMNAIRKIYGNSKKGRFLEALNKLDEQGIESDENNLSNIWENIKDASLKYSKLINQMDEIRSNYIENNSYKLAAKKSTLDMNVKLLANNVNNIINEAMNNAGSIGETDTLSGVDFKIVNQLRDDKGTAFTIEKYHDGNGALVIDNPSIINKPIVIPVDNDQLGFYFPITQQESPLSKAIDFIRANGGTTSNTHGLYGPNAAATAVYKVSDFPMIAPLFKNPDDFRFDIKGDLYNNGDPTYDKFNLIYYVRKPDSNPPTWVMYESPTYKNLESIYEEIQYFSPTASDEILELDYKKQKPQR